MKLRMTYVRSSINGWDSEPWAELDESGVTFSIDPNDRGAIRIKPERDEQTGNANWPSPYIGLDLAELQEIHRLLWDAREGKRPTE